MSLINFTIISQAMNRIRLDEGHFDSFRLSGKYISKEIEIMLKIFFFWFLFLLIGKISQLK